MYLDQWQQHVLEVALGERPDGQWAAREVGLIVPRQNGKGSILEALELAGLFLFGYQLILHSAHEFKTAKEAFLRIRSLVENTPDLASRVKTILANNNDMSIELKSGQRLRFVARTGGSGRGFSGDLVVLDEAYNLRDTAISALMPTMSARENPQIWYTSSAPLPDEGSAVLRRLCKRGREGSAGLVYFEWQARSDEPDSETAWAEANPGYPHRIGPEAIHAERGMMTAEDFARERLGLWIDPLTDIPPVIPWEAWLACCTDQSQLVGQQTFALDVAEDRSWSAFASAGTSNLGEYVHAEVIDYREGTFWTVARAVELKKRWGGKFAIAKGSPASSLIPALMAAGLKEGDIVEVSTETHAQHCGQLFDAVVNDKFRHFPRPELDTALRFAVKRDVGDAWVWARRKSNRDISPLVAVTLAAGLHGLTPRRRRVGAYSMAELMAQLDKDV